MIRTIIIEDEKPAVRRLEKLLGLFSDLQVVASLNSVEESVDWFQNNEHPQLIFSDILEKNAIVGSSNIAATKTAFPISALVPPIFVII